MEHLLPQIRTLADKLQREWKLNDADRDDLIQEGCLAVLTYGGTTWRDVAVQVDGFMQNHIQRFLHHDQVRRGLSIEHVEYEDRTESPYAGPEQLLLFKERVARVAGLSARRVLMLRDTDYLAYAV